MSYSKAAYLRYFIVDKNVQYVEYEDEAYILAKLNAVDSEKNQELQAGFINMKAQLFQVSEEQEKEDQFEPKSRREFTFTINQVFMRAFEDQD